MLTEGVYLPPSGYEMWTLFTTLGDAEIDRTLAGARTAASSI